MKGLAVSFASLLAYILSLYCSLALAAPTAQTGNVTVGVNVVGIEKMNEQQQDALIAQLKKDGVKVVRTRAQLIETMRGALAEFARQGRLAAFYFAWGGHPGEAGSTIFRCGALTDAGKLALSPM